jgi:hypothetical protein
MTVQVTRSENMSLNIGNRNANSGMTKIIYDTMDGLLRPPMEADGVDTEAIAESQEAWKTLSFAIATGVVSHLRRQPPTEPEYGEVFSSAAQDRAYWNWLDEFATTLEDWAANPASTVATLRTSLNTFFTSNSTPTELKGVIR